ncbi:hypothetical protein BELL_0154g00040 [Botrytis elliptica]|uniref:Uncharacterized protein n=1 Tax=Botrytis elliptica TaxID=278938 RepID=A0A4Z1JYV5_9HELO|nr:hypothetical protein EAE99_002269 [Botrytis elliptica]TGO76462.1 hypothetical protein BELL_0154g00040 [Botrytis elliptica]
MEKSLFAPKLHGPEYKRILTTDSSSEDGTEISEPPSWFREVNDDIRSRISRIFLISVTLLSIVLLFVSSITITGLVICSRKPHRLPVAPEGTACGGNPTAARLNGCVFDPMMSAWIPRDCVFDELVEHAGDIFTTWDWYSDVDLTQPINGKDELDFLRAGNYTRVWTSHQNAHELHCVYIWRKMGMALRNDPPLVDASNTYRHVTHCSASLELILQAKTVPEEPEAFEWPMMYHTCSLLKYDV